MGRFRAADAAIEAASHSEDEALYDRLGERHDAAIQRLLRTPAPDLAALALKLDLLVAQQVWEMRRGELCLDSIREDAHRFARGRPGFARRRGDGEGRRGGLGAHIGFG